MGKKPDKGMPSAKHLQAIGRVVIEWSRLEWLVEDAVHRLAGLDDDTGRMLTTHMPLDKRFDALLSLVDAAYSDSSTLRALKHINKDIRSEREGKASLLAQRNWIIHSHWESLKDRKLAFVDLFRSRGRLKIRREILRAEDVDQIAEKISAVSERLWDWLVNLPPPSTSLHK